MFLEHHANSHFCATILAGLFGVKICSTEHKRYGFVITALKMFVKGYYNCDDDIPHDYRKGLSRYHKDPTKWIVRALS